MGSILNQDEYFHLARWPKKAVDLLIETISAEALYGEWDYKGNMAASLGMAKNCLEREFGLTYSDVEIHEALDKLHEWFIVWRKLMDEPDVMINKWSKRVSAKPTVWEHLIMDDERVKWYGHEGEKAFDDLEMIFQNPFKGKEDFVFLGEVSGLHTVPPVARLDQVELPPLPVAPTPPRGRTFIDRVPSIPHAAGGYNQERFSPNPQSTPDLRIISKGDYEKSLSAKNSKHKKRLFIVPDSPISSVGSSSNPIESSFEKLRTKFDKSG